MTYHYITIYPQQSSEELIETFRNIPITATGLSLMSSDLVNRSGADLASAFKLIPKNVMTLTLFDTNLNALSAEELITALSAIPEQITHLDLDRCHLGDRSPTELIRIFHAIPKNVTSLDLDRNDLDKIPDEHLIPILNVNKNLTSLRLCNNNLSNKMGKQFFSALGKNIRSLNIKETGFSKKPPGELASILAVIPKHITTCHWQDRYHFGADHVGKDSHIQIIVATPPQIRALELSYLENYDYSPADLAEILQKIPEHVTTASFENHHWLDVDYLTQAISLLPKHITHLKLIHNCLAKYTMEQLTQLLNTIPAHITSLDLPNNFFFLKEEGLSFVIKNRAELIAVFQSLPKQLTALNLSCNGLGGIPIDDIIALMKHLPEQLRTLNLADNHFSSSKTPQQLIQVFETIPEQVREITLHIDDIISLSEEQLIALGRALPHVMKFHIIDDQGNNVNHPSAKILNRNIGNHIRTAYKNLLQEHNFPTVIVLTTLESLTGFSSPEIAAFIADQEEPMVAPLEPSLEPQHIRPNYAFQFQCLHALAILSLVALVIGITAICLVNPIGIGIGLTTAGAVGLLVSGYRLFNKPGESIPTPQIQDDNEEDSGFVIS